MKTTLIQNGNFYKGNIHCHSVRSDGHLTVDELVHAYQEQSYDFLAITDHSIYSNYKEYNTDKFILIQGVEANPNIPEGDYRAYHFIALPGSDEHMKHAKIPFYEHDQRLENPVFHNYGDIQNFIDDLYYRGYQVMINHPFWSRIEYDEILPFHHLFAVEIFSYCSHILENVGESNVCYDALLRNGMRLWATAVDDNHNTFPLDSTKCDSFGGFIVVKAASLDERAICNAIAQGSFYASQGPQIYDFYIQNNKVHFFCSPVSRIYANGDCRQIRFEIAEDGGPLLTSFESELYGNEAYVRIECYDQNGKKAYTNPIWLK